MAGAAGGKQAADALARFTVENAVSDVDPDAIYAYDKTAQTKLRQEKPWATDPKYFKHVKISALALLKMVCSVVCVREGDGERGENSLLLQPLPIPRFLLGL